MSGGFTGLGQMTLGASLLLEAGQAIHVAPSGSVNYEDPASKVPKMGESWRSAVDELAAMGEEPLAPLPQRTMPISGRPADLKRGVPRLEMAFVPALFNQPPESGLPDEDAVDSTEPRSIPDEETAPNEPPHRIPAALDLGRAHLPVNLILMVRAEPPPPFRLALEEPEADHEPQSVALAGAGAQPLTPTEKDTCYEAAPTREAPESAQQAEEPRTLDRTHLSVESVSFPVREPIASLAPYRQEGKPPGEPAPAAPWRSLVRDQVQAPTPPAPASLAEQNATRPVMAVRFIYSQQNESEKAAAPSAPLPQSNETTVPALLGGEGVRRSPSRPIPPETTLPESTPAEVGPLRASAVESSRQSRLEAGASPASTDRPAHRRVEPVGADQSVASSPEKTSHAEDYGESSHPDTPREKPQPESAFEAGTPRTNEAGGRAQSPEVQQPPADLRQPIGRRGDSPQSRGEARPVFSDKTTEAPDRAATSAATSELRLKLELPESEPVHLRFVERAGEVHVLVRSDQPGASARLASGLDEFQRSIEAGGPQVESWVAAPEVAEIAAPGGEPVRTERESAEHRLVAEQDRSSNRGNANGQQRGGRTVPEWLDLLSEREDEAALRRFQNGRKTWAQ